MTNLTNSEIKTIYFGIVFLSIVGVLSAMYIGSDISIEQYQGETETYVSTSPGSSDWIASLTSNVPEPFNDPALVLVTAVLLTPTAILLSYIAIRALKDLLTQWV